MIRIKLPSFHKRLLFILFFSLTIISLSIILLLPKDNKHFLSWTDAYLTDSLATAGLSQSFLCDELDPYRLTPARSFSHYDQRAYKSQAEEIQSQISSLQNISRASLSEENKQFYDIISWTLHKELQLASYPFYKNVFSLRTGIQTQPLALFCEYKINDRSDIASYLALLVDYPKYLLSHIPYLEEQKRLQRLPPKNQLELIAKQCDEYATLFSTSDNPLQAAFEHNLSTCTFISQERSIVFKETHVTILKNEWSMAYQTLSTLFHQYAAETPSSVFEQPLFPAYYERLAQASIGTDLSINELFRLGKTELSKDLQTIYQGLQNKHLLPDSTNASELQDTDSLSILSSLQTAMTPDFPSLKSISYEVKKVPDSLSEYQAPAFYLISPIDAEHHTIYLNPQKLASESPQEVSLTLAHEGFPGHLYQNAYFLSTNPNPCRRLFYSVGYAEGWAVYAEEYAYRYSQLSEQEQLLYAANRRFTLGIYAMTEIGIHYYRWTDSELEHFLATYGLSNLPAKQFRQFLEQEPGAYLPYYFGYLSFCKLKEQRNEQQKLSDYQFHEQILSFGPAPFTILEQWMN